MKSKSQISLLFFLACISLSTLYSCEKEESGDNDKLVTRFQGKYKIVRATSDRPVNLNLDGSTSTDLFAEIPNLDKAFLTLRLNTGGEKFIYSQLWPNQFIRETGSGGTSYTVYVDFASQATAANFTIDLQENKFNFYRDWIDPDFPLPVSLTVLSNNNLELQMVKKIYTSGEWININVKVEYERFTTEL